MECDTTIDLDVAEESFHVNGDIVDGNNLHDQKLRKNVVGT